MLTVFGHALCVVTGAEGRETLSDEENHMAVAATSSIASPVTCSEDGIAVNGSRVDDDDVCGARFSDDEKQDTEGMCSFVFY